MIRTKILHGKVDMLLIDGLPEGSQTILTDNRLIWWPENNVYATEGIELPPGNWQPINWLDKVSEEEAKGLVEYDNEKYYKDYTLKPTQRPLYQLHTAIESLLSLVEVNVKIRNKHGHCPVTTDEEFINKWFEEEAKVWKNIYLLKKID